MSGRCGRGLGGTLVCSPRVDLAILAAGSSPFENGQGRRCPVGSEARYLRRIRLGPSQSEDRVNEFEACELAESPA